MLWFAIFGIGQVKEKKGANRVKMEHGYCSKYIFGLKTILNAKGSEPFYNAEGLVLNGR